MVILWTILRLFICGGGILNLKEIIKTAQKVGVKHFFVEQDIATQPSDSLKQSHHYLDKI